LKNHWLNQHKQKQTCDFKQLYNSYLWRSFVLKMRLNGITKINHETAEAFLDWLNDDQEAE
jgi:hypothetical protein